MVKNSMIRTAFFAFALVLMSGLGAFAQKSDCSKVPEARIVDAIYADVSGRYKSQIRHVNIRYRDGVVTVEGWVTTRGVKKDIEKYAGRPKCVRSVKKNLTVGIGGGCGPGSVTCGDICIPANESCNIRIKVEEPEP